MDQEKESQTSAGQIRIRFYKTNRAADPGYELSAEEVARQFWASDAAREWLDQPAGRLERLALNWVPENIGQWEKLHEDWETIYEAICEQAPWSTSATPDRETT